MPKLNIHIPRGEHTRTRLLLIASLVGAFFALGVPPAQQAVASSSSYQWPMKPFDKPHPIRGSFGDPRTLFRAPPTQQGMMRGTGSFAFHFGVDISAPDGTKVYPVLSGPVTKVTREWVAVDVGNGRTFQYWHIEPAVRVGDRAVAGKTVLGTTMDGFGHLHFSELINSRAVSPLREGGLSPYADTTVPEVKTMTLRRTQTSRDLVPNFVSGTVLMVAEAYDRPELAIPAPWNNMPVTPARVTWRIQHMTGKVVVPSRVARDVRYTIPTRYEFWDYYARGTFQNFGVFAKHYSYGQPGRFLFKLTKRPFDTASIKDGVYDLVVTASDIAGNSSSKALRFTVRNHPELRK
jgi:murein DD-endopeptidase MepM/ murein hydrolase activator NlpD